MTDKSPEQLDRSYQNNLYPEDQQKVDAFVKRGINSVQRKPFRPMRLMIMLIVVVNVLLLVSRWLVHHYLPGAY
jgi:hypothetical protein